jgi:hypothetical protein
MIEHYVFTTEAEAIAAEAYISQAGGVPIVGLNAKTGEPMPNAAKTERWAIPQQRLDGKWVFPKVPDAIVAQYPEAVQVYFGTTFNFELEAYNDTWFATPEEP